MLQTTYYEVANRLERIDFPSIWPGFSSGSFALYQEKLACLGGQLVPRPPEFRGNTAISWQGGPLAIWNLEQETDLDLLASCLVHELFHAHQLASGETRFPQDIRLALSPAPLPSLASRLQEGRLLAQAVSAGPDAARAHLTDFCALAGAPGVPSGVPGGDGGGYRRIRWASGPSDAVPGEISKGAGPVPGLAAPSRSPAD